MIKFYSFIEKSTKLGDPSGKGIDLIKPVMANFGESVDFLKRSIRSFEEFDARFSDITKTSEEKVAQSLPEDLKKQLDEKDETLVNLPEIQAKLFSDSLFGLKDLTEEEKMRRRGEGEKWRTGGE